MPGISLTTLRHLRALVATSSFGLTRPLSPNARCIRCASCLSFEKHTIQASPLSIHCNFSCSPRRYQQHATPPPKTHYDLFPTTLPTGPPPSGPFILDARALRKEFLQLQAKAHPDLHATEDKARAEATSAYINEAYRTLLNPLLRAQYLLSLRGIDVANDETAKVDDPELLMHILELRERVEEAQSEEEIAEMKQENEARIADSENALDRIFKDDQRMEDAKQETIKLRYWTNVRESLDAWEKGKEVPPLVH
ncbi:MAG: hypothetical protein M1822_000022 [Bathelium mastoideum]|nr:MAG: hypothetical protein M1822_000022 [Bathelium mastoideum]